MKIPTFLALAAAISAFGGDDKAPAITLKVFSELVLEDGVLARAKNEAIALLGRSGIVLTWLDCIAGIGDGKSQDPCQLSERRAEFRMHFTSYKPPLTPKDMLGYAEAGELGVYYPAVVRVALYYHLDASRVMGAAIAHEVGHLILGANAHAPQGVMRGDWTREDFQSIARGELHFTADQAKLLQAEVKRLRSDEARPYGQF